ncbi:MAG: Ig-like domain-containing protein, partial [Spirochaetota bacterium]
TEEDDFKQVEGTGNWEYTIDVTDREPGKYNILVRARDAAGNVALGGPYNVVIDPQSDLPRTTISYPVAGEAVGERLLVVGSARDDDAVGYVEVQIGDGPFVRAEGTDYWSALVPVGDLEDGPHTVRARAVDVNGTEGEPVEVPVRLDTTRPLTLPTSHESGVLISRRTTVEGTVDDANGVESLTLVAGDERRDLSLRGRGEEPRSFSFRIDPREMEDGAVVWWIEAVDGTGSIGITPFLFFVDTSAPVLEVLSPTEEDRVDAQLRIVGRATDEVGVASLTYELSTGEAGEIPLTPGDPYWSIAADLDPDTRGRISADLTIVDIAGNERSERLRYEIDSEGDMPIVSLHAPGPGAIVERAYLAGHVADDDAGATVVYSIDRGAEQTAELGGAAGNGFVVPLEGLAPGEHEVRLRAVDMYGSEGPEVRRSFTLAPPPGAITIGEIVRGDASDDYAPGFVLEAGERASLRGSIAPNGSAAAGEIAWSIGPESGTTRVDEAGRFEIGLPRASEGGAVAIELVAQSAAGVASAMTGFYVQLPEPAEDGSTPAADALLDRGLYLGLAARANDEAPIVLEAGESIRLRAIGGAPSEPELSPQADFLSVRTDGEFVVLEATGDGTVDGLEVSARVGGARVSAPAFALRTELDAPAIAIPDALIGRRVAEAGELALAVSDASGVASVAVAVQPAGSIDPAPGAGDLEATAGEDGFTVTPRLPSGDGPAVLRVVATDESGRSASLVVPFVVDTTAPQLVPVTPVADEPVNGTITVHALLSEPASTTSAVAGEEAQTTLEIDRLIVHELSVSDLDGALPITLTDSAGNTATRRLPVNADETADLPELQLQVPPPGGLVQQEFRLSGVVLDDDAPASVTYAVDDGREVTVETDGIFTIDVPMGNLEDGDHTVTVFATDIGGAQSEPIVRTFAISRSVPETDVTAPALDAYLRDELTITGTSEDPNGIAEVFVSTDNGTSFQRADGTEEWTYRLDTTLLDDGTHSVLVRAVDGAGESSLLSTTINVDNTVPVLELVEPHDGVTVSGEFLIDGRGEDGSLELVRVVAQALGSDPGDAGDAGETTADAEQADAPTPEAPAAGPPIELVAFDEPGPFAYLVDTSTLEP